MAHRTTAPFRSQRPEEIRALVQGLEAHKGGRTKAKGGNFSVKKHTFQVENGRTVDSWRMNDWDYKKPDLPSYARGLFTCRNTSGVDEIVVRGYDKFFNHGEINKTQWRNVEQNTRGPYELSVKENGCIIFMAGLDDDSLLVCSKHSTGSRNDTPFSHAQAGERWAERHLASVGKTKADLAAELRRMNATAVAELCDDEFEEHVLAYTPDQAGLYLHGININVPEFMTYPGPLVDRFADDWGFKKTMYVMEDDIGKVKVFLDGVADTGVYAGRSTEGFVIRCQARDGPSSPFYDWFFKYKFEEPYLMYRQWRECTKSIIAGKPPKYKKHEAITAQYIEFAKRQLAGNRSLSERYKANHGIIKMRDDFLDERGVNGSDIIRQEIDAGQAKVDSSEVTKNVVLVPVATIGCGKTTVAVALVKLFAWAHVQNDNIQGKVNRSARFAETCANALKTSAVLIADRNNHQKREREQFMRDFQTHSGNTDVRFVALHWVHDRQDYQRIRQITQDRVLSRGDNHQTIQVNKKSPTAVIGIMEGFLGRFQPVNADTSPDDKFDMVIDLDVTNSPRANLETIISSLNGSYPKLFSSDMPTSQELAEAIDGALNDYKPDMKHDLSFGSSSKARQMSQPWRRRDNGTIEGPKNGKAKPALSTKIEYFGIRLRSPNKVLGVLDDLFKDADTRKQGFYRQLKQMNRVQANFHVTLIHSAAAKERSDHWEKMLALHANRSNDSDLGPAKVQLERLVWDDRVMCFVVRLLPSSSGQAEANWQTSNSVAHVTVGTAGQNIKPVESNELLQRWLDGPKSNIQDLMVPNQPVLDGVVEAVMRRR